MTFLPQVWLHGEIKAGLGLRRTVQGPVRKLADSSVVLELALLSLAIVFVTQQNVVRWVNKRWFHPAVISVTQLKLFLR